MLYVTVPGGDYFDNKKAEFIYPKNQVLQLEHSLVSLAKWEANWKKPFLSRNAMTIEETIDYIRCMTLTQNVDPEVYYRLTKENLDQVSKYIEDPMTATKFKDEKSKPSREVVTAEILYYQMITLNVPFECQKWHLNRLLTLIKVCNLKNSPSKKMSQKELLAQNKALNDQRKQMLNTKG